MKKCILAAVAALLFSTDAMAQFQPLQHISREMLDFRVTKVGDHFERTITNNDNIDYIQVPEDGKALVTIHPGHNLIKRWKATGSASDLDPSMHQKKHFTTAGREVDTTEVGKVIYALPVASGKTVKCRLHYSKTIINHKDSLRVPGLQFITETGDSVFCVRNGIVCRYKSDKTNAIYIYHDDGSITLYHNVKSDLKAGKHIKMGDLVGTMVEGKKLRMNFGYFDVDTFKKTGMAYKTFSPLFRTTDGDVQIYEPCKLTAVLTPEMKKQEK